MTKELTQSRLKELLKYDPETGVFVWLVASSSRIKPGKIAGWTNTGTGKGYLQITVFGKSYLAHRLAWFYVYGAFPSADLDHKNLIKSDNRIDNLRPCTESQNLFNVGIRSDNKSGFKGVSWNNRERNWYACISISGKTKNIGSFETAELASAAYQEKARELHGEFYREQKQ